MTQAYITFKGVSEGPEVTYYPKQALANAAALDNVEIVAHVGILDVGDLRSEHAYFDGTNVVLDTAYEQVLLDARTDLQKKKDALWAAHIYLKQLAIDLTEEGVAHPITEVHAAHNFPAFCHHGLYLVAHDDDYTDAQVIAFAEAIPNGPSNASTPFEWYVAVAALDDITGPDGPCSWVDPDDASIQTVLNTKSMRTTIVGVGTVTDTQLSDGAWIEGLT